MRWIPAWIATFFLATLLFAADGTISQKSPVVAPPGDSVSDSVGGPKVQVATDSISRPLRRADTVFVAKHQFRHRDQIITGSAIMACLVGILMVMNNYNPR